MLKIRVWIKTSSKVWWTYKCVTQFLLSMWISQPVILSVILSVKDEKLTWIDATHLKMHDIKYTSIDYCTMCIYVFLLINLRNLLIMHVLLSLKQFDTPSYLIWILAKLYIYPTHYSYLLANFGGGGRVNVGSVCLGAEVSKGEGVKTTRKTTQ